MPDRTMPQGVADIQDVCNFILREADERKLEFNVIKLQLLLYYTQALHLAFYGYPLFEGRFQAWMHGPVNLDVHNRFTKTGKNLYSPVLIEDVDMKHYDYGFEYGRLHSDGEHIVSVLSAYGNYTGSQLGEICHKEDPWIQARAGIGPAERCETEIDQVLMADFYRAQQVEPKP